MTNVSGTVLNLEPAILCVFFSSFQYGFKHIIVRWQEKATYYNLRTPFSHFKFTSNIVFQLPFRNITYQRILSQLAQCEIAMVKSAQVYKMNEQEQKHYNQLNTDIGMNNL